VTARSKANPTPKARPGRKAPGSKLTQAQIDEIFARFQSRDPDPKTELQYQDPFTLLVAVVLSAQATDTSVNRATPALFAAADTPAKMVALGEARVTDKIKTIGLYRNKAKNVVALSKKLVEEPRRLTSTNPQVAMFGHGEQRTVTWKSAADSESIEGVLSLPVGYQPGTKVPLLVVVHGGPAGVSAARYPSTNTAYPVQIFNSLGYAVLQPNFRGSTGYGARFRGLNHGDILGKDWIDVNSGVDAMIRTGIADSTKMGLMGWSYGGFQTFWGVTQTSRFAAASSGAGVNDLTAFFSQTDISDYLGMLLNSAPWEKPELYVERSAYRKVKDVTTPLLIQSGAANRRVSPEQSIQFYEAMKRIGKAPVKLVLYPGQGHGISDVRLSKDRMLRNVEWFSYWVPVFGQRPVIRMD
jgi:dipeptidyl aminopeptidase/acylaminoacyl peptidase